MGAENDASDAELDQADHDVLIANVLSLGKARGRAKKPVRTEPSLRVSEFDLVKSLAGKRGQVHLEDLTRGLKTRAGHVAVKKRVANAGKALARPLEKPQAERIGRTLAYERSRLKLDRWEAFVQSNRAASHLRFPFNLNTRLKQSGDGGESAWALKSELQKKLEAVEAEIGGGGAAPEPQPSEDAFPMTLAEIKERRKEMAKLRAHQSYRECRARQRGKIKSKSYHRALRRERLRSKIGEFERLQKEDPEEALKRLDEIEKIRAEERMSLRHRGAGKWARSKQIRAKYDKESRKELAEQLRASRDLTQKVRADGDDDDDDSDEREALKRDAVAEDGDNPWQNNPSVKPDADVEDFVAGYRKYWRETHQKVAEEATVEEVDESVEPDEKPKAKAKPKRKRRGQHPRGWTVSLIDEEKLDDMFEGLQAKLQAKARSKIADVKGEMRARPAKPARKGQAKKKAVDLSFPARANKPVIDEALEESGARAPPPRKAAPPAHALGVKKAPEDVDPDNFVEAKPVHLDNALPDVSVGYENEPEQDQSRLISEAFEDDDVAEEFGKEKADAVAKASPTDVNLTLPGWGTWGGKDVAIPRRKRKRFLLRFPGAEPRRDRNRRHLVLNERANKKVREHQVSELPFPFKTVKDFEASIRAPMGSTFVPETAFRRFTRPAVSTRLGAVIEPADGEMLVRKPKVA